jgi:hypothetical protein
MPIGFFEGLWEQKMSPTKEERGNMINQQYHKGQTCKIKPVFCQEGYCSECSIYLSKFSRLETAARLADAHLREEESAPARADNLVSAVKDR